jgi:hypothetical protein
MPPEIVDRGNLDSLCLSADFDESICKKNHRFCLGLCDSALSEGLPQGEAFCPRLLQEILLKRLPIPQQSSAFEGYGSSMAFYFQREDPLGADEDVIDISVTSVDVMDDEIPFR